MKPATCRSAPGLWDMKGVGIDLAGLRRYVVTLRERASAATDTAELVGGYLSGSTGASAMWPSII